LGGDPTLCLAAPAAWNPTRRDESSHIESLPEVDTWDENPILRSRKIAGDRRVDGGIDVGFTKRAKELLRTPLIRQGRDTPEPRSVALKNSIKRVSRSVLVVELLHRVGLAPLRVEGFPHSRANAEAMTLIATVPGLVVADPVLIVGVSLLTQAFKELPDLHWCRPPNVLATPCGGKPTASFATKRDRRPR
jgi:hypothetical protein